MLSENVDVVITCLLKHVHHIFLKKISSCKDYLNKEVRDRQYIINFGSF